MHNPDLLTAYDRALSTSDVVVGEDGHLRLYDFSSSADNVAPGEFIGGLGGSVHSSAPEVGRLLDHTSSDSRKSFLSLSLCNIEAHMRTLS